MSSPFNEVPSISRLRLTAMVSTLLTASFLLYSFGVGYLIKTEKHAAADTAPTAPQVEVPARQPGETARVARKYLAKVPWAEEANMQFRDGGQLFYFAQNWEQLTNKREMRFEPLAMVWFGSEGKEPIRIIAESAVLTFQRELEVSNPKPGRVVKGQLTGQVQIDGADNLSVSGRQFIFSESSARIWTDNAVAFTFQDHRGHAAGGLQIDLKPVRDPKPGSHLAVADVRQVHLNRDVHMNLRFEQDGDIVPLAVDCKGVFTLAFDDDSPSEAKNMTATFRKNVVVNRPTGDEESDRLLADRLILRLERNANSPKGSLNNLSTQSSVAQSEQLGSKSSNFKLKQIDAVGIRKQVVMTSDANDMEARMRLFSYFPEQRKAVMRFDEQLGIKEATALERGRAPIRFERVIVRQGDSALQCYEVEFGHDKDGKVEDVVCRGAGRLEYSEWREHSQPVNELGLQARRIARRHTVLSVQWKNMLRKYPDERSRLDIIDLSGDAIVRIPEEQSGISADYIKLWMDPLDDLSKKLSQKKQAVALAANEPSVKSEKARPLPHRMLAIDRVTMVSPEMHGRTDELQVWFDPAQKRMPVIQPTSTDQERSPGTGTTEPDKIKRHEDEKEPVIVNAKLIRVRVLRDKDPNVDPQLAEVWSEGNVTVRHRAKPGEAPMTLSGRQLHLKNRGANEQVVHLFGSPAKIADASMNLEGAEVLFDRKRNYVWSDGAGTLTLPVKNDFEGNPLPEPTDMTISWNQQMAFDGLDAVFVGRVHAKMLVSVMRCQQMKVTMAERVLFEKTDNRQQPEIAKVIARYHVEFDSHEMADGGLSQVRRARFAEVALDQKTGRAEARGPGSVTIWKLGRGKRAGLAPSAVARANRAVNARNTKWEYTRIDFANEMIAKTKKRTMEFVGQVQVVYGPVKEPLDLVDLDNLPKDGGAMYCDTLEVTQRKTVLDDKFIELLARDNARLEGRSFSAQAFAITYDESKELYTLRSKGDQQAMLWRETAPGLPRTPVVAKTFMFQPARNFVDFDNASLVRGLQ